MLFDLSVRVLVDSDWYLFRMVHRALSTIPPAFALAAASSFRS